MLKLQVWVWLEEFSGHVEMNLEEARKELEPTDSDFILDSVLLASEVDAGLLCIGTELGSFVKYRPAY